MRVLSLKNPIQLHLMVHTYTHTYTLVYMHALKVNCLRPCAHTFLYHSLSLSYTLLASAPCRKGNCNYNEGVARRKQLTGRQAASSGHKLFVVLWLPSCLPGKYIACGWCAFRIYVAPTPLVQYMGAYCFKYNCFTFFICYKSVRPTGLRGVKCLGFQHSIKREFI